MKMKKIFAVLFFFWLLPALAFAHQPRIAEGVEMQVVENPEVSKAYYGELKGGPEFYQITSDKEFKLYLNLLVPDIANIKKDVSAEVYNADYNESPLIALDGLNFNWSQYYEKYAGDNYFKGPEYSAQMKPGTYTVKVYSPDNLGKYVLAVGEKEDFNLKEVWNTIMLLPRIKAEFFGKPPIMALYNVLGEWLLIGLGVILVLIAVIIFIIKKIYRKNENKNDLPSNNSK
jgi:hypothetical protein